MHPQLNQSEGRPLGPAPPDPGHTGSLKWPRAGFLAGGFALLVSFGLGPVVQASEVSAQASEVSAQATVTVASIASSERVRHPRNKTFMKRQWGVEVVFVRRTAGGYMLEFRYKVIDADKAKPLFERQTKPLLTHVESGARMIVPTPAKTGALRNSNPPLAGHTYWMFFANPAKFVQPGERVSIEIGDFLADNLVVQ